MAAAFTAQPWQQGCGLAACLVEAWQGLEQPLCRVPQVASVLDMIDDMSKGGGEDIRGESHHAGAHRRMDLIRRIVDKGIDLAPGLRGNDDLSTRVEELAEMHEAANSRCVAITLDFVGERGKGQGR